MFYSFWGAYLMWVRLLLTIRVAWLDWFPLPLTMRCAWFEWVPLPSTVRGAWFRIVRSGSVASALRPGSVASIAKQPSVRGQENNQTRQRFFDGERPFGVRQANLHLWIRETSNHKQEAPVDRSAITSSTTQRLHISLCGQMKTFRVRTSGAASRRFVYERQRRKQAKLFYLRAS